MAKARRQRDDGMGRGVKAKRRGRKRDGIKSNSRKSVRWSAVPVAHVSVCGCVMVRGAAAPKGPMTYAQYALRHEAEI